MGKRVLALVAAAAMVLAAVLVRSRLDRGSSGTGSGPTRSLALTCSTELAAACTALERVEPQIAVTIEPAATTQARLASSSFVPGPAMDGWLVANPWVGMVDDDRSRAGLDPALGDASPPLARSPLVLVSWKERASALAPRCRQGQLDWECLGRFGGQTWASVGGQVAWGPVKPGHASPDDGVGLLVLGQATAVYFNRPDVSTADFDNDAFQAWLTNLERSIPSLGLESGTPLERILVAGPAAFDAVGTIEAEAGPLLARSPGRSADLTVTYPAPMATADVVYAPVTGSPRATRLARLVESASGAAALAGAGWRVSGQRAAAGVPSSPALPSTDGLPAPGVLEALRNLWRDVTR